MTPEQAVLKLREDPSRREMLRDTYIDEDLPRAAERFSQSAEFAEVRGILGPRMAGARVLDVGAGNGIASYAFAKHGASRVYAAEPDGSDIVGAGAIRRLTAGLPVEVLQTGGAEIGLPADAVDIVYARQVLHHIIDLDAAMREFARVLRPVAFSSPAATMWSMMSSRCGFSWRTTPSMP